jgi:hypothetical protein
MVRSRNPSNWLGMKELGRSKFGLSEVRSGRFGSIGYKLIREERRLSCADGRPINGGKNVTAVEEGQTPIKDAGRRI